MRTKLVAATIASFVGAPTNVSAAADVRIDLAAIIGKTDAESALGEPVTEARTRNGDGADGYYSRCNYYSENPGKSLVLRVRQAAAGSIAPKKQFEMLGATGGKIKPVSGLGEKAGFVNGGAEGLSANILMLYVTKGNAFVMVGVGGLSDDLIALEKAKSIARKILTHL